MVTPAVDRESLCRAYLLQRTHEISAFSNETRRRHGRASEEVSYALETEVEVTIEQAGIETGVTQSKLILCAICID